MDGIEFGDITDVYQTVCKLGYCLLAEHKAHMVPVPTECIENFVAKSPKILPKLLLLFVVALLEKSQRRSW